MRRPLTRDRVLASAGQLPSFPTVIKGILATLDDPDASGRILERYLRVDPVVAGRVLCQANATAMHRGRSDPIRSLSYAVSLIGQTKLREIAVMASLQDFVCGMACGATFRTLWLHSIAVGICSEEVACAATTPVSHGSAMIAGLLHDVGQLWLLRFEQETFSTVLHRVQDEVVGVDVLESEAFGVDHATIGAWLAESWLLPHDIVSAVLHHHRPDAALDEPLVPVMHVAELLSHALDLASSHRSRVTSLSAEACARLGLVWDDNSLHLFGRIDGRSRHAGMLLTGD